MTLPAALIESASILSDSVPDNVDPPNSKPVRESGSEKRTSYATTFAGALADRTYNSPQELVAAYQAARDALPPPQATSVAATCSFAGERIGSITYQDTPAELFVTTDSFGRAHLTALAIEDCHRVIEVTVP